LKNNRLKELREAKNVPQREIAELLDITDRHYRQYEAGHVDLAASKLIILADYFDCSIDYLVGRTENKNVNH
jgi:transcriptional regulator with XRE-family HTH domain